MIDTSSPINGRAPITGRTRVIAHIGYPTDTFTAPLIYNPWFAAQGIDAVVVPMAVPAADFAALVRPLLGVRNMIGALVTMPHKVASVALVDALSPAARIAGACNAIRAGDDGRLLGDMFDGDGFVRGAARRLGRSLAGASALVVGSGGVGSAIAAALAAAGIGRLGLHDIDADRAAALAARLYRHYPGVAVQGGCDPAGFDIAVNATPLGMREGDALPFDPARLAPGTLVGEVVLRPGLTPLLAAAQARGCVVQLGTDMLFEMIPAYLEFFGLGTATPDQLRATAMLPAAG